MSNADIEVSAHPSGGMVFHGGPLGNMIILAASTDEKRFHGWKLTRLDNSDAPTVYLSLSVSYKPYAREVSGAWGRRFGRDSLILDDDYTGTLYTLNVAPDDAERQCSRILDSEMSQLSDYVAWASEIMWSESERWEACHLAPNLYF